MIQIPRQLWAEYQAERKEKSFYHKAMSDAGLTDIKCTRKFSILPFRRVSDSPGMGMVSFLLNTFFYITSLSIYEGTKKSKST